MLQAMTTMESEIMLWVQEYLRRDWLDPIWIAVTTLGNGGMIWILLSVGLLIPKKTRKTGMLALLALAFSYLINNLLLKNLIARTRPYEVIAGLHTLIGAQRDYSFPSGHTAASFASVVALFMAGERKLWKPALLLAVLIAFSRLYLYVHYPTDVLGGLILGLIAGYLGSRLVLWLMAKRENCRAAA